MDLRSKVSSPLLAQSGHLDRACDRLRMYLYVRQICEGLECWPSLQWQRYGRRYVPLLSSHRSSRGRFVGGAPWSNSLKRYCRVAIVNIHCCSPHAACSASKRARAFFPSLAAAVMLKKSLASFLAAPTDRHGKFPISMLSVGFLATSRRQRSQSG
jgi:hypothetical protein